MVRVNFNPSTNDTHYSSNIEYGHYGNTPHSKFGIKDESATVETDLKVRVNSVQRDVQQAVLSHYNQRDMIEAVFIRLHKVQKYGEVKFKACVREMMIDMIFDMGFDKYPKTWYLKWDVAQMPLIEIFCGVAAFHLPGWNIPSNRKYLWKYLGQKSNLAKPSWLRPHSIAQNAAHHIDSFAAGIQFIENSDHEVKEGSQLAKALETAREVLIKEELSKQKIHHKKGELNMKSITVKFSGFNKGYEYLVPEHLADQLPTKKDLPFHDYVAVVPGNNSQEDIVSVAKVYKVNDVASKQATVLIIDIVPLTENLAKNKAIYNKITAKQELLRKAQERYENANKLALYEKAAENDPDMKALLDQIKELDA